MEIEDRLQLSAWIADDGVERKLSQMTPRHRRNLKRWLRRNAEKFKLRADLDIFSYPLPSGEMAAYYAEQEQDAFWKTGSVDWMIHTPLYQRLIRLCWRDRQDGEVV